MNWISKLFWFEINIKIHKIFYHQGETDQLTEMLRKQGSIQKLSDDMTIAKNERCGLIGLSFIQ